MAQVEMYYTWGIHSGLAMIFHHEFEKGYCLRAINKF